MSANSDGDAPRYEGTWEVLLAPDIQERFEQIGWDKSQWRAVDAELITHEQENARWGCSRGAIKSCRVWLRLPGPVFAVPVTPAEVLASFAKYGPQAREALLLLVAGAPAGFFDTFTKAHKGNQQALPQEAWWTARSVGLSDEAAIGWAETTRLFGPQKISGNLGSWVKKFGPGGHLWVLAGFTLEEAITLRDGDVPVSEDQLRVMAALHQMSAS